MQNIVSTTSAKIIYAHMTNNKYDPSDLLTNTNYRISFYDGDKNKIFGNLEEKIDFNKKVIQNKRNFIVTDDSTLGHLGVFYIAIEENIVVKQVSKLQIDIALFFLVIYSFIVLTGFYLAKLFLRPIKEEREKLNNFIKDTTHELNTPISAILMSTEGKELSEKQVERVRLSAKRVSEIYKDLTYIFLQNHSTKKESKNINLNEIILEQIEYLEPLASKKRVKITTSLDNYSFKIDKDDFIRLFNNLFSNAIKYNKISGTINVTLRSNILEITDSGIGIEKDKLKDIFKRYYRATKEQGGFGIGLNIVSQICKTYNISLSIESKLKEGTTFRLTF